VALASLALLSAALAPAAVDAAQVVDTRHVDARTLELTVRTDALAGDTHLRVLLPEGYDARPRHRYPVVYLLHAALGNYKVWTDGINIASLAGALPVIFVMPDGGRSGFYSDWWNSGAGGTPQWERYHVGELVPLIDSTFRTQADRSARILLGGSMGGFGAMSYAARHPDLFGAAISLSGAVDTNFFYADPIVTAGPLFDLRPPESVYGPRLTQEIRWRGHNPVDLAENLHGVALQVRTWNGMPGNGNDGFDVTEWAVHAMSVSFHSKLDQLQIPHTWVDYGPGGHTFEYARVSLLDSLAELGAELGHLPPAPKRFDFVAIEPRFSVWGWSFAADPGRALEFMRINGASRHGLTLTGSGQTTVTTAPYFRRFRRVFVAVDGTNERLRPDRQGRISFSVDLGPPHKAQQYTPQAQLAGQGSSGYFRSAGVTFTPRGKRR
jgi:S-formylglutathione hydrolase FrmB